MNIVRVKKRGSLWLAAFLLCPGLLDANPVVAADYQSEPAAEHYRTEILASPGGIIWALAFVDAERLLYSQRDGRLGVLAVETGQTTNVTGLPEVFARGQGGLLDVAVEPTSAWIYLSYAKPLANGEGATALARTKLLGQQLQQWQELLVTESAGSGGRHFGSRIAFDGQGHVFFSVGDRGERQRAQALGDHAGSIIRLKLDGSVPADNPFVDEPNARPEIWSYGHRNPQGLVFDEANGRLWSIEHGPRGGDEINLIEKGQNYGWPLVSHGREYLLPIAVGEAKERAGMASPRKVYIPSIAPSSLLLYQGQAFPQWRGHLFAGALKLQHINRVALSDNGQPGVETRMLEADKQRIRALAEGPNGWIYFSSDNGDIARIRPLR